MIMNGEIGRYESVRFVEQTHIAKGSMGTAGTEGVTSAWTSAKSFRLGSVLSARILCAEAIAVPEEIRGKIPGDFGTGSWCSLVLPWRDFGITFTRKKPSHVL